MSADRTHFVYRAFDEFDNLLYIGCTKQPGIRWKQHVAERRTWAAYAKRFRVVGPLPRRDAFDLERLAIDSEDSYFNSTTEHRRSMHKHWLEVQRLLRELEAERPDLFHVAWYSEAMTEFSMKHDEILERVAKTHPVQDDSWRHARYLSVRRQSLADQSQERAA